MPGGDSLLSLLWVFVCVVLIIGLAYLFTKHVAGRGLMGFSPQAGKKGLIKVIAQMPAGKDRQILLIQAGERYFLIGNAPSGITNLAEFTPEEAKDWLNNDESQSGGTQPPSFREAFQTALKQRIKR